MGIYTEYINKKLDFAGLETERKKQLNRISQLRDGRNIFVYAAATEKIKEPISIVYSDLTPITDQIEGLSGDSIDVILETSGGSGEIAEDIIKILRHKFDHVGFIVPGSAKSAGTLMVMAGDEILMEPSSSVGPIDAQISFRGQIFSADALLEGLEKIREKTLKTGKLNPADFPILQNITPGDIQSAENALSFAQKLVTDWLAEYKFKFWDTHPSTGQPVTDAEKKAKASEIAKELCDHGRWLTHGRSIKLSDLRDMGLKITDYSENKNLHEAIRRYYILLKMSFDSPSLIKVFETEGSQIYRHSQRDAPKMVPTIKSGVADIKFVCAQCKTESLIQGNLGKKVPLKKDFHPYPKDDNFTCPSCKTPSNLSSIRSDLEKQSGLSLVPEYGKE